uniref:Peptidase S1 domain-containing protein n=1 Tax=Gadus morhua TaxID=8049 RepID=A0A8C5ABV4_GADMO
MAGQFADVLQFLWGVSHQQSVGADRCPLGFTVFLGRQDQGGSNPNEQSRTISRIVCHPDYSGSTNDNDICLLQLSSAVTFTDYIAPVCLAADGSTFNSGIINWVTGWGTTSPSPESADILQEVDLPIVGNRECDCSYGRITNNMICAGLSAGGKDSCQGDSGGPLVVKQGPQWVQSGVVSFGQGCALPKFPGVYARVSEYQAWINGIITTNQPGFVDFRSGGINSDHNHVSILSFSFYRILHLTNRGDISHLTIIIPYPLLSLNGYSHSSSTHLSSGVQLICMNQSVQKRMYQS